MTPGALLGPIGRPDGKKWIIVSIRLSKKCLAKWKQSKITFKGVIGGKNLKILKIFIFWFFDFVDRFYTFTYASDLFAARRTGHRSRSTYFILPPKVVAILFIFPLTVYRIKWSPQKWNFNHLPKSKIGASMRDPNFGSATPGRHLALGKTRFVRWSIFDFCRDFKVLKRILKCWNENLHQFQRVET